MRWAVFISILVLIGCAQPKGHRKYVIEDTDIEKKTDDPHLVKFRISTLDSIKPYIHVFPTGIETEAPNLDPRFFYPPDSTLARCVETLDAADTLGVGLSIPDAKYEIIGEVESTLNSDDQYRSGPYITEEELPSIIGPNNKPFIRLSLVDWQHGFDDLRESAVELGADAVIEVFCAKGVSSFWYPPSTNTIPTFGPNGQIIGSYSTTTPGGIGLSGWKIMGLAVRWRE